jgi:hypothetical protein
LSVVVSICPRSAAILTVLVAGYSGGAIEVNPPGPEGKKAALSLDWNWNAVSGKAGVD